MSSLYVVYNAKNNQFPYSEATGWISLLGIEPPKSTIAVQALCKRIAEAEGFQNVIILNWLVLPEG